MIKNSPIFSTVLYINFGSTFMDGICNFYPVVVKRGLGDRSSLQKLSVFLASQTSVQSQGKVGHGNSFQKAFWD